MLIRKEIRTQPSTILKHVSNAKMCVATCFIEKLHTSWTGHGRLIFA
jgi:hypothetical protein